MTQFSHAFAADQNYDQIENDGGPQLFSRHQLINISYSVDIS